MASSDSTQRPAKRTKLIGASDRVAIDVGGTKFVAAAASTLTSNSAYFASLLSGNWNEAHADKHEIGFLDQDPVPFGKLLAFMRRGLIKVDEIDADVLALANFLGVERLLLAVKIRAYQHLGVGPDCPKPVRTRLQLPSSECMVEYQKPYLRVFFQAP